MLAINIMEEAAIRRCIQEITDYMLWFCNSQTNGFTVQSSAAVECIAYTLISDDISIDYGIPRILTSLPQHLINRISRSPQSDITQSMEMDVILLRALLESDFDPNECTIPPLWAAWQLLKKDVLLALIRVRPNIIDRPFLGVNPLTILQQALVLGMDGMVRALWCVQPKGARDRLFPYDFRGTPEQRSMIEAAWQEWAASLVFDLASRHVPIEPSPPPPPGGLDAQNCAVCAAFLRNVIESPMHGYHLFISNEESHGADLIDELKAIFQRDPESFWKEYWNCALSIGPMLETVAHFFEEDQVDILVIDNVTNFIRACATVKGNFPLYTDFGHFLPTVLDRLVLESLGIRPNNEHAMKVISQYQGLRIPFGVGTFAIKKWAPRAIYEDLGMDGIRLGASPDARPQHAA